MEIRKKSETREMRKDEGVFVTNFEEKMFSSAEIDAMATKGRRRQRKRVKR